MDQMSPSQATPEEMAAHLAGYLHLVAPRTSAKGEIVLYPGGSNVAYECE
jgi:hypothetical protein